MSRIFKLVACMLSAAVIGGCSGLQNMGKSAEEIVTMKAEDRWRALIEGDLERAYSYFTPAYRKLYSFEKYRGRIKGVGVWKDVKIESVKCEDEHCSVNARVYATFMHPRMTKPLDTEELFKEGWVFKERENKWFFSAK
jgi:hypothetical protein